MYFWELSTQRSHWCHSFLKKAGYQKDSRPFTPPICLFAAGLNDRNSDDISLDTASSHTSVFCSPIPVFQVLNLDHSQYFEKNDKTVSHCALFCFQNTFYNVFGIPRAELLRRFGRLWKYTESIRCPRYSKNLRVWTESRPMERYMVLSHR